MNIDLYSEAIGLSYEEAIKEAERCLNCHHKPCVEGCVAHMEIPSMIMAFLEGRGEDAKRIAESKNSFPEICGRVCYQDIQCEAKCVRMKMNAPVKIGLIERYIGDHYRTEIIKQNSNNKRIAIIGSGPSGLSCAMTLREAGFDVTVFEKKSILGGVLKFGIPPYRLPNSVVDNRIEQLLEMGVQFKIEENFGRTRDYMSLLNEGFDAMYLAMGASKQNFSKIDGSDHPKLIGWKQFLSILNIGEESFHENFKHIKRLCVVGGGNVAMDVVISAAKFGIETHLIYRRTIDLMPARKAEVNECIHLGVIIHELSDPIAVFDHEHELRVKCKKTKLIKVDENDRGTIVDDEGIFELDCDLMVIAIGSSIKKLNFDGLALDSQGRIIVDEYFQTNIDRVYAAGDIVSGTKTVIHALYAGKQTAENIIERFREDK
jgi:glutamate synthase (NADPH) small chain